MDHFQVFMELVTKLLLFYVLRRVLSPWPWFKTTTPSLEGKAPTTGLSRKFLHWFSNHLWGLISLVLDPRDEVPNIWVKHFTPLKDHVIPLFFRGFSLGWRSQSDCSLLFLPDSVWIFPTALAAQVFSVRIVPHIDVFLICLWWWVSSTSSYSTSFPFTELLRHIFYFYIRELPKVISPQSSSSTESLLKWSSFKKKNPLFNLQSIFRSSA